MADVVNDRDVLIMGTTPRYTAPTDRGMFLTPSTAVFKLSEDGLTASPSSFQFVATLLNMTGNVTWSTTGGISLSVNGNTAMLDFASFTAVSGTITASITVDGQQYTQITTVTKLADGSAGPRGVRGNVDIAAVTSGSVWSESEAAAALAAAGYGAPQVRDLVKLYKSDRTFSVQKMYNGSAWVDVDYVYDGSFFVKGSILPEAIDTRGLTIRDASGNIILNAGATLASQVATNPNLVPRISSWNGYTSGGGALYVNTTYPATNGENIYLPGGQAGTYIAYESSAIPLYANEWYTVSFWALTENAVAGALQVDMYGTGAGGALVDTAGLFCNPPALKAQYYTFTEQMPSTGNGAQRIRFYNPGGAERKPIRIWDVKVERGKKATPWCDNIITKYNISTYIQSAAMDFAYIDKATIPNLSSVSATIGTLRTATSGARIEISDNLITGYRSNNTMSFKIAA